MIENVLYVIAGFAVTYLSLEVAYLPKVDSVLLNDLLLREEHKSERAPFIWQKFFTTPVTNSGWCKRHITELQALSQQYMIKTLIM
jgi:hypothetical protein